MIPTSPQRLTPSSRDEVVGVLADAFDGYPVMRYVLGEDVDTKIRALVGFYADKRFDSDWPVFGIREHAQLVGVALVTPPNLGGSDVDTLLEKRLCDEIGEAAVERMRVFEAASDANEPLGSFAFVGMLGVRRAAQGRGYARALLDRVKALALQGGLDGVALSTEDPNNLPFYEHVGFEVVAHLQVPGGGAPGTPPLDTWGLCWRGEKNRSNRESA